MYSTEHNNDSDPSSIFKKTTGVVLILIGISIGIWVVSFIHDLLGSPSQIELINIFANQMDRTITFPSGEIELPGGFYVAGGYLVICVLLSICAGVAKTFITAGAHLLQTDFKNLVTRLTTELQTAFKNKSE